MELLRGENPFKGHPSLTIPHVLYRLCILPLAIGFLVVVTIFRELFIGGDSLLDLIGRFRLRGSSGLVQRSASKTAIMVCLVRYIGSKEGWTNDSLSRHFLPVELVKVIDFTKFFEPKYPVSLKHIGLLMTRTLAGDRLIKNSRPKQVVLLGAGLDTRAHRLDVPPECKFYEVDIATTQKMKREVVSKHPEDFKNKNVRYVSVDFSKEAFTDKLVSDSDFDLTCPDTVILFEGVSMYLPWEALKETMTLITSRFAKGTVLGMDVIEDWFTTEEARSRQKKFGKAYTLVKLVSAVGEPFQWGVPVGKTAEEVFTPLGFELVTEVKAEDVEREFLSPKGASRPFARAQAFWHYIVLKVK